MHVWDLRMQRCIQQQQDQGTILGTSLAISPSADMFAAGSDSGVVNLYEGAGLLGRQSAHAGASSLALPAHVRPAEPVKSFLNLRDEVDTLSFSPDGQVRCFATSTEHCTIPACAGRVDQIFCGCLECLCAHMSNVVAPPQNAAQRLTGR